MKPQHATLLVCLLLLTFNVSATELCNLQGQAIFYSSGPYGIRWSAEINKDGSTLVEFNNRMLKSTEKQEKLTLDNRDIDTLCQLFGSKQYLELPKMIQNDSESQPFHAPWFVLEFSVNEKKHRVDLYNPKGLKDYTNSSQFVELWERLGEMMPIKPPSPREYM